jgi:glycerate-2-kinase
MKIVEQSTRKDLIICLISGGGSALLPLPKEGVSLEDLQIINSFLLASGASIHEINTIRKHLSNFKGGNLAKKLYNSSNATLLSLIISDVVGNKLDSIASGPTVPDLTTFNEAIDILKKYNILDKIPSSAKSVLEQGLNDEKLENPKPKDVCFENVHNYLIGSVKSAAEEAISYLKEFNYDVNYFSNEIIGEAREFGNQLLQIINQELEKDIRTGKKNKIALIGTGELTVTIKGNGTGGRNQEMLLSLLLSMINNNFSDKFVIIAANLDGIEGNSEAMGAIIDNHSFAQVHSNNLIPREYLDNNDSNTFFKILKSEIITGPTGCNVNDLIIALFPRKE